MVSSDYLPNIGGLAAHVYYLGHALQGLGHDVFVINPIGGSSMTVEQVSGSEIPTFRVRFSEPDNKIAHISRRSFAIVEGLNQIFDKTGSPDILHQHDHRFSTFAMQWASRNTPWVWTNHTSSFLRDYSRGKIRRWLIKNAYRGLDGLITVSNEIYDKSHALWGNSTDIKYIPNGVDTCKFSPEQKIDRGHFGLDDDEFVVLCPRRMAPKNGVIYMARAATQLVERHPDVNWRFVFLGGDPSGDPEKDEYAKKVKVTVSRESLQHRVSLLGNLPLADMPRINACADVVVMPSLMEAVSLSALEGMATQKPVVATNVGGLPQIIHDEETGLLVSPEDPGALADSINRLYRDSELRHDVARRARELVAEQYSWEAIARKTVKFYQNTLSQDKVHV